MNHILHMANPADCWENASPIGNGSMGAMIFGGTETEKIYLSEESIWSEEKRDPTDPSFREKIDILRKMHLDGNDAQIDKKAEELLSGSITRIRSAEYAGIITVEYEDKSESSEYRRDLNLNNALLDISFKKNGVVYTEHAYSAYADEVTAIRLTSEKQSSFSLKYSREHMGSTEFADNILLTHARTAYGNKRFAVGIKIVSDGKVSFNGKKITVKNHTATTLFISITTQFIFGNDYTDACRDILSEADDFEIIKENHTADFSALFEASDICFDHPAEFDKMTVAQRLDRLKKSETAVDMGLPELYFAFGKYLMLSSSRESTLPANLQGVWVEKLENPWNADYHTNINLQMNYWLCETANLGMCHMQLFDYMNNYLLPSGRKTAEINYKCRGTVTHHLSDIYGFTTPADGLWGIWPMGGAWLAYHMWEHYLYTKDTDFLLNTAYEYIRDCAMFFVDYLFTDNDGKLVSGPSTSPENRYFIDGSTQTAFLCFAPTMDIEIISGLLKFYIETENILNISPANKAEAQRTLDLLPPLQIGKHGQLMEWREDHDEPEPGHRHISHAFALHPGNRITEETPELFEAIKTTLKRRLENGGGHTGWSRAWLINLYARLKDGENTYRNIMELLRKSTLDNLLDSHPPFQIDGNFGGAAGIAEALLQSHEKYISVLPAVTEKYSGSFTGLKARGNITVSAEFTQGKLKTLQLCSPISQTVKLRFPNKPEALTAGAKGLYEIELIKNQPVTVDFHI